MDVSTLDSALIDLFDTSGYVKNGKLYLYDTATAEFHVSDQWPAVQDEINRRQQNTEKVEKKTGITSLTSGAIAAITGRSPEGDKKGS